MRIKSKLFAYSLFAVVSLLLLNACVFRPSPLTEQEQVAKFDTFIADGGYRTARLFETDSLAETWRHEGQAIQISLLAPRNPGTYPLIVYFPGLGEPADAGRLWREHWAKAGYVVLSVQPEPLAMAFADLKTLAPENTDAEEPETFDDIEEWQEEPEEPNGTAENDKRRPSRAAINDELRYVGHEFFSPKALGSRIAQVSWAYAQCKQRTEAKLGLCAKADLSHVLLAGYDIGAQTVSALIGEQTDIPFPETNDIKPQGAILISPSLDAAAGKFRERYQHVTLPFLAITADGDEDPYAITTPGLRSAIWDYAASTNKYRLLLKHATHRLLSGSGWSHLQDRRSPRTGGRDLMQGFANGFHRSSNERNDGPPRGGMGGPSSREGQSEESVPKQIAAIASVSTAFFDSIAKEDNFAVLWLTQKARPWLKSIAEFTGN